MDAGWEEPAFYCSSGNSDTHRENARTFHRVMEDSWRYQYEFMGILIQIQMVTYKKTYIDT